MSSGSSALESSSLLNRIYERRAASIIAGARPYELIDAPESLGRMLTQLLQMLEDDPNFPLAVYHSTLLVEDLIRKYRKSAERQTEPKKASGSEQKEPDQEPKASESKKKRP